MDYLPTCNPSCVQVRNNRVLCLSGQEARRHVTQDGGLVFPLGNEIVLEAERPRAAVLLACHCPEPLAAPDLVDSRSE